MYCTHDLADGSVFGGRSCGEAVEDDGVARLQGGAHKVDENERCNAMDNQTSEPPHSLNLALAK